MNEIINCCLTAFMKKNRLLVLFLTLSVPVFSQSNFDNALVQLNHSIISKKKYDADKVKRINSLEQALQLLGDDKINIKYELYAGLYDEYKSFSYDKAFDYAQKMLNAGRLLSDPVKIAKGKIALQEHPGSSAWRNIKIKTL